MSMSNKLAKAGMMGDYMNYMGDPGFFGSLWKGIKSVGRVATGVVGGLGIPVVSGVARTAGGILFGGGFPPAPGTTTYPTAPPMPMPPTWASPGAPLNLQISRMGFNPPFGGAPGVGLGPVGFGEGARSLTGPPPQGGATMGGYHLNKTGYFLKSGEYVAPGSRWVKNRRRNPGNMRALSRSLGRIKSAKRMTKALNAISIRSACPPGRSRKRSA